MAGEDPTNNAATIALASENMTISKRAVEGDTLRLHVKEKLKTDLSSFRVSTKKSASRRSR